MAVTVELHDIYPPAVPAGLIAASFSAANAALIVDLSWQPVLDSDLAGYNIYRQLLDAAGKPTGQRTRLNAKPIPLPAYQDQTLPAGTACSYAITAIDRAGNESAPSQPATFTP